DSGHGDSDQADSDQDTNKGSCCDMSAKEALKMKATGLKPQPLEQGKSFNIRNFIKNQRLTVLFAIRLSLLDDPCVFVVLLSFSAVSICHKSS
ncbi:hypothetical protein M9458_023343, partial [Cirrhinus mrigala]